jgi:hypothetical protein
MQRSKSSGVISVAVVAFLTLVLHVATLSRYGFYRDELYFLACFHHLAWGFVDQPPLVPIFAGLATLTPDPLFGMRILAAVAAALAVMAAADVARELGAARFGQVVTAIATALMPASLFLGNTLTTTSFEPLTWTLVVLLAIKLSKRPSTLTWSALAIAIAAAAYMKYSILLLAAALIVGLFAQRSYRLARLMLTASVTAVVLLLPNLLWQSIHGFPMIAVLHGDIVGRHAFNVGLEFESAGVLQNAAAFSIEQIFFPGAVSAPLWIAGIVALLRRETMCDVRFIGYAFIVAFIVALDTAAKGYYIIGIYPALFAAGSVSLEHPTQLLRPLYAVSLTVAGLLTAPLAAPLLPVETLIAYTHTFGAPNRLVQPLFADEFGWNTLASSVAHYYDVLPEKLRARTPVFADTYGYAAALDYYGGRYGLPPPISAQNQYYLWGTHGYDLSTMLAVGASQYWMLKRLYRNVHVLGTFSDPYRWAAEGPAPIYLCSDPIVPEDEIWPRLKWYGA